MLVYVPYFATLYNGCSWQAKYSPDDVLKLVDISSIYSYDTTFNCAFFYTYMLCSL